MYKTMKSVIENITMFVGIVAIGGGLLMIMTSGAMARMTFGELIKATMLLVMVPISLYFFMITMVFLLDVMNYLNKDGMK